MSVAVDEKEAFAWLMQRTAVVQAVFKEGGDPFAVYAAFRMAEQLMGEHGVSGWDLTVGTAKVQGGSIWYGLREGTRSWDGVPGKMILSGPLMSLWTPEQQRLLILHEIAHIKCPDAGHGPVWRWWCHRLGIEPKRLYGEDGEQVIPRDLPRKWAGSCPGGHPHTRVRRPGKTLCCLLCSPVPDARYAIVWRKKEGE